MGPASYRCSILHGATYASFTLASSGPVLSGSALGVVGQIEREPLAGRLGRSDLALRLGLGVERGDAGDEG